MTSKTLLVIRGVEYHDFDDTFTEDELKVFDDWENQPREVKRAIAKKHGWDRIGGLFEVTA